ncbi:MAG TPA: hypothetical protein VMS17_06185 [Gemmataceae bacterium]|nr:hypothetical protein [Gemmataceae bacterium]
MSDLIAADHHTWGDRLTHFMEHCEKNPVMQVVTEPLRKNSRVNGRKWCEDFVRDHLTSGMGYRLPTDDEDCSALLYQFFYEVEYHSNDIDIIRFSHCAFGESNYSQQVYKLNKELVAKLTREIAYRLDEAHEDIGDAQEVPREAMVVFHYHNNKTTIQGGVYGSVVATGGSTVSDSSAAYNDGAQLAAAIESLKGALQDVSEGQRETVGKAVDALAQAARLNNLPVAQVAQEAKAVASASRKMGQFLLDLAAKAGAAVAGSVAVLGIKEGLAACGLHLP